MGRSNRSKERKKEPQRANKEQQRALPSTNALKYDGEWFHRLKSAAKCYGEWFDRHKVALMKLFLNPKGISDKENERVRKNRKRASRKSPENRPRPSGLNVDELMSSPESVKWASNANRFRTQIAEVFKTHQTEVPLLKDLDSYLAHLPRREGSEDPNNPLILYECPYYVATADLDRFGKSLLFAPEELSSRSAVRSIVAPSGAGKSAAVLPAFLQMQQWHQEESVPVPSMYIYVPFHNNDRSSHLPPVFLSVFPQFMQYFLGQAYMVCCFELMLHGRYYKSCFQVLIWFCRAFMVWARAFFAGDLWQHRMEQLATQAVGRNNQQIMVHVDEHFTMSENAKFRQGALSVLAHFDSRFLVVTTYTAVTCEFSLQPSDIKEYFVALPPLLSFEALSENEHWKLTGKAFNEFKRRSTSSTALSMWFSVLVQGMGPKWLHVSPDKLSQNGDLSLDLSLYKFYHDIWNNARQDSVDECCSHCSAMAMKYLRNPKRPEPHQRDLVFRLVHGIAAIDSAHVASHLTEANMFEHSVVGFEKIITKPLVELLQIMGGKVWEAGRTRLLKYMQEESHLISVDKVLECAFISASDLSKSPFTKRPESCEASALFRHNRDGEVVVEPQALEDLETNVLAFPDDKPCHPYVDLWIKTDEKKMTVMQVTGSRSWDKVKEKSEDLKTALKLLDNSQAQVKRSHRWKFHALMLAPNVRPNASNMAEKCQDRISILTTEARDWLGGFAQLCTYIHD